MLPRSILGASEMVGLWVFYENDIFKRFSMLLMLPCGRPRPGKIWFFCICYMYSKSQNMFICLDLSIKSMLERLVLKNAAECTSQRLKRTSGARVMIVFDEH